MAEKAFSRVWDRPCRLLKTGLYGKLAEVRQRLRTALTSLAAVVTFETRNDAASVDSKVRQLFGSAAK